MKKYSQTYKTHYSPQKNYLQVYNGGDVRPSSLGKRLDVRMPSHSKNENKFRYDKMITEYNGYGQGQGQGQRIRQKYDCLTKKSQNRSDDEWFERENKKILEKRNRWEENRFQNSKICNRYILSDKKNLEPYLSTMRKHKQENRLTKENYYQEQSSQQLLSKYTVNKTHKNPERVLSKQGYPKEKIETNKGRPGILNEVTEEKRQHKITKENSPKFRCQVYLEKSTILLDAEENEVFMEDSFGINQGKKSKEKQKKKSVFKKKEDQDTIKNQKYLDSFKLSQSPNTSQISNAQLSINKLLQPHTSQKHQKTNQLVNQKRNNQPYMLKSSDYKLKQPKTQLNIKYKQQRTNHRYEAHPPSNQHEAHPLSNQHEAQTLSNQYFQTQQKENKGQEIRHRKKSSHKKFLSITSKSMDKYR